MNSFKTLLESHKWEDVKSSILSKTSLDVERALASSNRTLEDFKALISPAAEPYLEKMAQLSHELTQKRFGKTIQMYIPIYLSNACANICTYCGFSANVKIRRIVLTEEEIEREITELRRLNYDHVLIVTGETPKVGTAYFKKAIRQMKPHFSNISMEVQPLEEKEYTSLIEEGLNAVLVYQETYHRQEYKKHHPFGKKSDFDYRIDTAERLGRAKIHKMGLGVLIGLEDWRTDSFFCAMHLNYLEKKYWQTKYAISFPRLRPCANGISLKSEMTDKQLVQLICAYRIFNEEVELSLSTRESESFRNNVIKLGITSISAESKTDPGGYASDKNALEQFEVSDQRSTDEFIEIIKKQGYEAVFKDWDHSLQSNDIKEHA